MQTKEINSGTGTDKSKYRPIQRKIVVDREQECRKTFAHIPAFSYEELLDKRTRFRRLPTSCLKSSKMGVDLAWKIKDEKRVIEINPVDPDFNNTGIDILFSAIHSDDELYHFDEDSE